MSKLFAVLLVVLALVGTSQAITLDHHNATGWDYASIFGTVSGVSGTGAVTVIVYGKQTLPTMGTKTAWATWYFNNGVCVTSSGGSTPMTNRRGMSIIYGSTSPGNVDFTIKVGAAAEVSAGSIQWSGQLSQPGSAVEKGPVEQTFSASPPVVNASVTVKVWVRGYCPTPAAASAVVSFGGGRTVNVALGSPPAGTATIPSGITSLNGTATIVVDSVSTLSGATVTLTLPDATSFGGEGAPSLIREVVTPSGGGTVQALFGVQSAPIEIHCQGVSVPGSTDPVDSPNSPTGTPPPESTGSGTPPPVDPGAPPAGPLSPPPTPPPAAGTPGGSVAPPTAPPPPQLPGGATYGAPSATPALPPPPPVMAPGNGGAAGVTQGDIYTGVYNALMDAGNRMAAPPSAGSTAPVDMTQHLSERGKLDAVQGQLDGALYDTQNVKASIGLKVTQFANTSWIPTSGIGTVSGINFGSFTIAGRTCSMNCDFTPLAGIIAAIRALILFATAIFFTLLTVRTVRNYL